MAGWIKLHRDLATHWVAGDPESLSVFVRLLMEANYMDTTQNINGNPTTVRRGDLIFGLPAFSARSGVSISKLRRVMDNLKRDGMIRRQNFSKFSIVSIVNYDQWQSEDRQTAGRQQADSRQTTTPEEGEEGEKGNKPLCSMDDAFEVFWGAGMRKAGKATAEVKFEKRAKEYGDPMEFAAMLAHDIGRRNAAGQLGFDKMMPSTYLNQKRWEDERPEECPHEQIAAIWNELMPAHITRVSIEDWRPGAKGYDDLQKAWEHLKTVPRKVSGEPVFQTTERGLDFYRMVWGKLAASPRLQEESSSRWCKFTWAVKVDTTVAIAKDEYS